MTDSAETPEMSHVVRLDRLGTRPQTVKLAPDQAVREKLATRFGILRINDLQADLRVRRRSDNGWVEVTGAVRADLVQECVATLEPVPALVEAEISELFVEDGADPEEATAARGRLTVDLDPVAEDPEPLEGGILDIGEIAAQALSLALDPYPRAPDASAAAANADVDVEAVSVVSEGAETDEDPDGTVLPFAKLAGLREKLAAGRNVKKT